MPNLKSNQSKLPKKTTNQKIDRYILYEGNNIISTDRGGNINIYSLKQLLMKLITLHLLKLDFFS